jgi:hypothetical protein
MSRKVDAFSLKKGPTESGGTSNFISEVPEAVGGELLPFDILGSLPAHIIVFLLLMIPVSLLLYRKRDYALNLVARLFFY